MLLTIDVTLASTVGQDFVFGYINNLNGSSLLLAIISNANDKSANITVTSAYPSFQTINICIPPNTIEKVNDTNLKLR